MKNIILFLLILTLSGCIKKEKIWFDNGNLKFEVKLKDGKRNGESIQYYPNGKIQIISNWEKGRKEELSKSFFKNGKVNIIVNYVNGKANGEILIYDSLGRIFQTYQVKDDLKNGEHKEFFPTGKLRVIGNYYNDLKHGHGIEYYEDGKLFRKYFYNMDSLWYFKGYDREGNLYDCVLPIQISLLENDKNKIKIKLLHTEYDSVRIDIIIGHLDIKKNLIDTLEVFDSHNLEIIYTYKKNQEKLTGVLKEIKMPDQDIEGEYYFEANINSLKNKILQ